MFDTLFLLGAAGFMVGSFILMVGSHIRERFEPDHPRFEAAKKRAASVMRVGAWTLVGFAIIGFPFTLYMGGAILAAFLIISTLTYTWRFLKYLYRLVVSDKVRVRIGDFIYGKPSKT